MRIHRGTPTFSWRMLTRASEKVFGWVEFPAWEVRLEYDGEREGRCGPAYWWNDDFSKARLGKLCGTGRDAPWGGFAAGVKAIG